MTLGLCQYSYLAFFGHGLSLHLKIYSENGLRIAQSCRIWHVSNPEPISSNYICPR